MISNAAVNQQQQIGAGTIGCANPAQKVRRNGARREIPAGRRS
jgi:hypothetical protein